MNLACAPLPVHFWPGAPPSLRDGVCVIAVRTDGGQQRAQARREIRQALREVLAGLFGIAMDAIDISSDAGSAPRIVPIGTSIQYPSPRCSISHEAGLSLAAINLRGAIGIDVMRVRQIPDWEVLARDYLGPTAATALAATAPELRAAALASAWTAYEASLKCLGLALREWNGSPPHGCQSVALILPDEFVATIAVPIRL